MAHKRNKRARLGLEGLEDRSVPARIWIENGFVILEGTVGIDLAQIAKTETGALASLNFDASGWRTTETLAFNPYHVNGVLFRGYDGGDSFVNDHWVVATAYGGPGNDYLEGGWGTDVLYGDEGDDTLVGFEGDDYLRGGTGNDGLYGMPGNDQLRAEGGRDGLFGGPGRNRLSGDRNDIRSRRGDGPLAEIALNASQKLRDYFYPSVPPNSPLSEFELAIVQYTNQERGRVGLAPLAVNTRLTDAARHHARNMAAFENMSHTVSGADLPDPASRLRYYGYSYRLWGENIAWNYPTAQSVVSAWINSPGHRANMLNPEFTEIGVGVAYSSRGEPYYAQNFGKPA